MARRAELVDLQKLLASHEGIRIFTQDYSLTSNLLRVACYSSGVWYSPDRDFLYWMIKIPR